MSCNTHVCSVCREERCLVYKRPSALICDDCLANPPAETVASITQRLKDMEWGLYAANPNLSRNVISYYFIQFIKQKWPKACKPGVYESSIPELAQHIFYHIQEK